MSYDQANQDPLSGREVVFTLDRGFRKPLLGRGIAVLIATVLMLLVASSGVDVVVTRAFAVVLGAITLDYAVRYLWVGRFRTRLTAEGIEIRGYVNHFVPWAEVADVEVTGVEATGYAVATRTASGRAASRLDSTSGVRGKLFTVRIARAGHRRRMLLRAPLVAAWQSDPEFLDKVEVIRGWWRAYGHGAVGSAREAR
jgi:hypothetical protein